MFTKKNVTHHLDQSNNDLDSLLSQTSTLDGLDLDNLQTEGNDDFQDLETESKKEIGDSLKKIRENEKKFKEQLELETDLNFYFQVVFESPKQMKEVLAKYGIVLEYGDFLYWEDLKKIFDQIAK